MTGITGALADLEQLVGVPGSGGWPEGGTLCAIACLTSMVVNLVLLMLRFKPLFVYYLNITDR